MWHFHTHTHSLIYWISHYSQLSRHNGNVWIKSAYKSRDHWREKGRKKYEKERKRNTHCACAYNADRRVILFSIEMERLAHTASTIHPTRDLSTQLLCIWSVYTVHTQRQREKIRTGVGGIKNNNEKVEIALSGLQARSRRIERWKKAYNDD